MVGSRTPCSVHTAVPRFCEDMRKNSKMEKEKKNEKKTQDTKKKKKTKKKKEREEEEEEKYNKAKLSMLGRSVCEPIVQEMSILREENVQNQQKC